MKLYKFFIASLVLMLFLSACGSSGSGGTSKNADLTAEEILEKSITAMAEVKSYSMEMDSEQTMAMTGFEEEMNMTMKMKADIITDPIQLYMLQEITSDELGIEEPMTTESYFTNDGFYTKDSITNSWIKYTDDMAQTMLEMQESQLALEEQLDLMKRFTKNITADEDNKHYILSLDADGDALKEIVAEVMGTLGGEDMAVIQEMFNEMDIQTFKYIIYIDKATFLQTKVDVETDMSFSAEEETITIKQIMKSTISNFDGVSEIKIPQEAIDSADEISFDNMFDLEDVEDIEGMETE